MPPRGTPATHRQVLLLATAQALFQTAAALVVTVGALAARQITQPPHQLATAPIATMFLGTLVTTIPASRWMARWGRRRGFVMGALLGALGGLVAAAGIRAGSLVALALGTLLIGGYQAFAQFYRFAAAEVSDDAYRPRAISLVLGGGVAAALLGPALGRLGEPLLDPPYTGSFLILAATSLVAAGVLAGLRIPVPRSEVTGSGSRPLLTIMRQPVYLVALAGAATGAGIMVLAMTATPLAMVHHEHSLSGAATVIQAHVLGMFLPSFFTGALIARFGVLRVMAAGAALLSGHVIVTLTGTGFASFAGALVLLGVGWNFLYIGGTTLLTSAYRPAERASAQAAHDLVILAVGLLSSLTAGALLQAIGWQRMNVILLPWSLLPIVAVIWLARRPPTTPPST